MENWFYYLSTAPLKPLMRWILNLSEKRTKIRDFFTRGRLYKNEVQVSYSYSVKVNQSETCISKLKLQRNYTN
jgi:hypothetical protein